MKFEFDWEKVNKFIHWVLPSALGDDNDVEHLSHVTDGFTRCELGITLNGVELDAEKFLEALRWNYEDRTRQEARRMVNDLIDCAPLNDIMLDLQATMERVVREKMDAAGISMSEWNE